MSRLLTVGILILSAIAISGAVLSDPQAPVPRGIESVNGSNLSMMCFRGRNCLLDGYTPYIDTSLANWASDLVTVRKSSTDAISYDHVLLTFSFEEAVTLAAVELDLFLCPEWGIHAPFITLYAGSVISDFITNHTPTQTSCECLSRVSISVQPEEPSHSIWLILVTFSPRPDVDWVHFGEVRLLETPTTQSTEALLCRVDPGPDTAVTTLRPTQISSTVSPLTTNTPTPTPTPLQQADTSITSPYAFLPRGIDSVNGSSADMMCSSGKNCLLDGHSPYINTSLANWASDLVTVRRNTKDNMIATDYVLLTFVFDRNVTLTTFEIDLFLCPEWGIHAPYITVYGSHSRELYVYEHGTSDTNSNSDFLVNYKPHVTEELCGCLSTIRLPLQRGEPSYAIWHVLVSSFIRNFPDVHWVHFGEFRFLDPPLAPGAQPSTFCIVEYPEQQSSTVTINPSTTILSIPTSVKIPGTTNNPSLTSRPETTKSPISATPINTPSEALGIPPTSSGPSFSQVQSTINTSASTTIDAASTLPSPPRSPVRTLQSAKPTLFYTSAKALATPPPVITTKLAPQSSTVSTVTAPQSLAALTTSAIQPQSSLPHLTTAVPTTTLLLLSSTPPISSAVIPQPPITSVFLTTATQSSVRLSTPVLATSTIQSSSAPPISSAVIPQSTVPPITSVFLTTATQSSVRLSTPVLATSTIQSSSAPPISSAVIPQPPITSVFLTTATQSSVRLSTPVLATSTIQSSSAPPISSAVILQSSTVPPITSALLTTTTQSSELHLSTPVFTTRSFAPPVTTATQILVPSITTKAPTTTATQNSVPPLVHTSTAASSSLLTINVSTALLSTAAHTSVPPITTAVPATTSMHSSVPPISTVILKTTVAQSSVPHLTTAVPTATLRQSPTPQVTSAVPPVTSAVIPQSRVPSITTVVPTTTPPQDSMPPLTTAVLTTTVQSRTTAQTSIPMQESSSSMLFNTPITTVVISTGQEGPLSSLPPILPTTPTVPFSMVSTPILLKPSVSTTALDVNNTPNYTRHVPIPIGTPLHKDSTGDHTASATLSSQPEHPVVHPQHPEAIETGKEKNAFPFIYLVAIVLIVGLCLLVCLALIMVGMRFKRRKRMSLRGATPSSGLQFTVYNPLYMAPSLIAENVFNDSICQSDFTSEEGFGVNIEDSAPLLQLAPIVPTITTHEKGPLEITGNNVSELQDIGTGECGRVVLAYTRGLCLRDMKLRVVSADEDIPVLVAVKKLKSCLLASEKEAFEKEINFLSQFEHPNFLRLLGVCLQPPAFIMMEYTEEGDLNQFLQKYSEIVPLATPFSSNQIITSTLIYMASQIANAMQFLASFDYIHRDISTRKCLVGKNFNVKLGDLGVNESSYRSHYYCIRGNRLVPIRWMATECFEGMFSEKSDVWAFGVTMWELFTLAKELPYPHLSDEEVIHNALQVEHYQVPPRPGHCPQSVYQIMQQCWIINLQQRATFQEVCEMFKTV